ncbi:rab11 family-interacting protein 5 [Lissotriton helveticus]
MSLLRPEPPPGAAWLPTHVQVTVLRARGLRLKGKHGTSDAFTIIQLGKERFSTAVAEKSPGRAEWAEECSFELPPPPGGAPELLLVVMHRALIGLDKFLGQAGLPLDRLLQEGRSSQEQWYKLQSKPGTKEKERGEIQVSIKFTRNNMSASMFNLSVKEKSRNPFGKLKDKMKGKKYDNMESASAIVPSNVGRLDSDDEDFQREASEKKPKSKGFFLKGKLRKSSLTASNSSIKSNNSISSTGGANNADVSIVVSEVTKKPAHRNLSSDGYDNPASSPWQTHKRAFSDEVGQLNSSTLPEPKAVNNLKPKNSPVSKSSVCVNGSHVYAEEPAPKTNLHITEPSAVSRSMQNIAKKPDELANAISVAARSPYLKISSNSSEKLEESKPAPPATAAHDESKVSTKVITLNHSNSKGKIEDVRPEAKPVQIATPFVMSVDAAKEKSHEETKKEEKKPKVGLFQHGSGKSDPGSKTFVEKTGPMQTNSPPATVTPDERSKSSSWFGAKDSKDATQKPSFSSVPNATDEADEEVHTTGKFKPSLSSTRQPERIEDLSANIQTATEQPSESMRSKLPAEREREWEDPFDAFATSRLLPECKDGGLSQPIKTNEHSEVKFLGSQHTISRTVVKSDHVEKAASRPEIVRAFTLQTDKVCTTVQEPLVCPPDQQETEARLADELQELNVTGKYVHSSLAESSPHPSRDNGTAPVLSARIKRSVNPETLTPILQADNSDKCDTREACLEVKTEGQENKVHSMELSISPLENNTVARKRPNEEPCNLSDCTVPNVKVPCNPDPLPNISKSAQEGFTTTPANICFEGKSENKIAAVSPRVLTEKSDVKPDNSSHPVKRVVACKDPGKDSHQVLRSVGALTNVILEVEDASNAHEAHLATKENVSFVFSKNSNIGTNLFPQDTQPDKEQKSEKSFKVGTKGAGLQIREMLVYPPKPPRCFTSLASEGNQNTTDLTQLVSREAKESESLTVRIAECPKEKMWDQNSKTTNRAVSLLPLCPTASAAVIEKQPRLLASSDVNSQLVTEDLWSNLNKRANESTVQDTFNGENMLDTNEVSEVEQFTTCLLESSLDGLDLLGVKEKSSKLDVVKPGLASASLGQHPSKQLNTINSGTQRTVQVDLLSSQPLAKEGKQSVSETSETNEKNQTGSSGLPFWTSLEEQLPMNELSYPRHVSHMKPLAQNEPWPVQVAQEERWPEPALNETVLKTIKKSIKTQVPPFHHSVSYPGLSTDCSTESDQQQKIQEPESTHTHGHSSESSWSADMVVDFKNVDFWKSKSESDLGVSSEAICDQRSTANPFVCLDNPPLPSPKNPFVETSIPSETFFREDLSFSRLHQMAAPPGLQASNTDCQELKTPFMHASQPLAFSTPFLAAETNLKSLGLPSPIICPTTSVVPTATTQAAALSSCYTPPSSGAKPSSLAVLPQETQPAERLYLEQKSSPHPVKPISAVVSESSEKKQQKSSLTTAFSSGLEKLRTATTGSVQPVAPSVTQSHPQDGLKDPVFQDLAAKYYHLTHDELIRRLLQREQELSRKNQQLQELESYIDQLLVRIMDHAPTLLQVPLEQKKK